MCANVFVTLFAVFALPSLVLAGDVVCYIDGEAQFLPTGGMYGFSNIPSNVCDIIVFRGNVYPSLNGPTQLDDEFGFAAFAATNSIPLLIAITDPSPSSSAYSDTVSNSAKRTTFVQSIVNMVSLYNLAGIEIDWQTIEVSDTANLVLFLTQLRTALPAGKLISLVVFNDEDNQYSAYSLSNIISLVDYFSVRTFDYVTLELVTQIGSPFSRQEADVNLLISNSVQPNQIIFNIPFHAFTFELASASSHGVGATTLGVGPSGQYTQSAGFMTYLEVTQYLATKGTAATVAYDDRTPYVYSGTDWITYENEASVIFKCEYTALNGLNVGLQLLSEDLNTNVDTLAKLGVACRSAINSCILGLICLL